jgi:DNA-binding NarL/FixJ family response regulator
MIELFRYLLYVLLYGRRPRPGDLARHYDTDLTATDFSEPQLQTIYQQDPLVVYFNDLTPRQKDVVALVCLGQRNHDIAEILNLSPHTVRGYLEDIYPKLKVKNRTELRMMYRDWDFQTWWMNRHVLPTEAPIPHRR